MRRPTLWRAGSLLALILVGLTAGHPSTAHADPSGSGGSITVGTAVARTSNPDDWRPDFPRYWPPAPRTTTPIDIAPVPRPAVETAATTGPPPPVDVVVAYARAQVGRPYHFAASGPNGFDCSGLTLAAYREVGIALPHHSEFQAGMGTGIDWHAEEIRPGDVIVVAGGRPRHHAGHVGVAISATEWVVAPSSGQLVTRQAIPFDSIEAVRRLID